MRECIRIFEKEYLIASKKGSVLADDKYLVNKTVYIELERGYTEHIVVPEEEDIAIILWNMLQQITEWVPPFSERVFLARDSTHDIGYVEDPFPFNCAMDEFGEPYQSIVHSYADNLPTLIALAKEHIERNSQT